MWQLSRVGFRVPVTLATDKSEDASRVALFLRLQLHCLSVPSYTHLVRLCLLD